MGSYFGSGSVGVAAAARFAVYPPSNLVAGDLRVIIVASTVDGPVTVPAETRWVNLGQVYGGGAGDALGNAVGPRLVALLAKEVTSAEVPSTTTTTVQIGDGTNPPGVMSYGAMVAFRKDAVSSTWETVARTAADETKDTAFSVTVLDPGLDAGDLVLTAQAWANTSVTASGTALVATGLTMGALANGPSGGSTSNYDVKLSTVYGEVTGGPSASDLTFTSTFSVASGAAAGILRVREVITPGVDVTAVAPQALVREAGGRVEVSGITPQVLAQMGATGRVEVARITVQALVSPVAGDLIYPAALPTDLSGDYDASAITGVALGSGVGEVPNAGDIDPATNGLLGPLTQGTADYQPTLVDGVAPSGLPVLRFDGTDDSLAVTHLYSLMQPNTIMVVASIADSAGHVLIDGQDGSERHVVGAGTPVARELSIWAGAATALSGAPKLPVGFSVITAVFDGVNSVLRINGTQVLAGDLGSHSLRGLTVGARYDRSAGRFAQADVGQILVAPRRLTDHEILAGEAYLTQKWLEPEPEPEPVARGFRGWGMPMGGRPLEPEPVVVEFSPGNQVSTTAPAVTLATTPQPGDTVVALLAHDANRTVTGPTGLSATWESAYAFESGSTGYGHHRWYIARDAAAAGAINWTLSIATDTWTAVWLIRRTGEIVLLGGSQGAVGAAAVISAVAAPSDLLLTFGRVSEYGPLAVAELAPGATLETALIGDHGGVAYGVPVGPGDVEHQVEYRNTQGSTVGIGVSSLRLRFAAAT